MDLANMKRPELQKLCKQHGLKASGKNAEMVARLEDYFQQEQQSPVTQVDAMEQPAAVVEEPAATSMDEAKAAPAEEAADSEKPIPTVAAIKTIKEEAAEDGTFAVRRRSRSKTAAELTVLKELEERVEQELLAPTPARQTLKRSKSMSKLVTDEKVPESTKKQEFEQIHQMNFNKMESIATHYAAKRQSVVATKKATVSVQHASKIPPPAIVTKLPLKRKSGVMLMDGATTASSSSPLKKLKHAAIGVAAKVGVTLGGVKPTTNAENKKPLNVKSSAVGASAAVKVVRPTATMTSTVVKKPVKFDLKASLAKPLSYKPHVGKLKPLSEREISLATTEAALLKK